MYPSQVAPCNGCLFEQHCGRSGSTCPAYDRWAGLRRWRPEQRVPGCLTAAQRESIEAAASRRRDALVALAKANAGAADRVAAARQSAERQQARRDAERARRQREKADPVRHQRKLAEARAWKARNRETLLPKKREAERRRRAQIRADPARRAALADYNRKWSRKNYEKQRAEGTSWRARNLERDRENKRRSAAAWRARNREHVRELNRRYRDRKRAAAVSSGASRQPMLGCPLG